MMAPPSRWVCCFVTTADKYAALQRRPTGTLLYNNGRRVRCFAAMALGVAEIFVFFYSAAST
jgi:hypothetical protein